VLVWHITWSVNSLTHIFGYRNHDTRENSRNNWLVALFACGEGWHNNHHSDPACCTVRHRWWELDITYLEIRALGLVGLAWDIVLRRSVRAARALESVAAGRVATHAAGGTASGRGDEGEGSRERDSRAAASAS
jgi:stearoyl-CoA desaturase (delta-9 desaturase)